MWCAYSGVIGTAVGFWASVLPVAPLEYVKIGRRRRAKLKEWLAGTCCGSLARRVVDNDDIGNRRRKRLLRSIGMSLTDYG